MRFGPFIGDTALFGVLPILPAASSLFAVAFASLCGLIAAIATLRLAAVRSLVRALWRQKWGILALSGVVVLGFQVVALTRARVTISATPQPTVTAWPAFRGTVTRTGHADRKPGPVQGGIQWSAGRGFEFLSSPAIVGNRIIAVGSQNNAARFFCWEASSGRQLWSFAPPGYRSTFSSPVFDGGYLVCGEGLHQTTDARLMCFNFADGPPVAAGHFTTRSHVECTPVIFDGRIYFGAGDDGIYCLEAPNDTATMPRVVWHQPGDKYPDAETALAVHDGRVYVGLGFGGEAFCVLDAITGTEIGRVELPQPVFSPPAIDDDRIYLGLGQADYVNYRNSPPGEVRCLDRQTLETIWTVPTSAALLTAIVAHEGKAIFSTVDGETFVIDRQGHTLYRWHAQSPVLAAPAVTERMIYCVSGDGLLTGLNHQLERVWSVRLGAPGDYISSPVVFRGHVYVGTPADGLLCVGDAEGDDATERADHRLLANSIIPAEVEVAWTLSGPAPDIVADVTAPPGVTGSELVIPMTGSSWSGLICADLTDSAPPRQRWVQQCGERIESSPIIRGDRVICLCGARGGSGRLIGLDRTSGRVLWNHSVSKLSGSLFVDSDSVYVQSEPRQLSCWRLSGERLWHTEVGQLDHSVAVRGEIVFAATTAPRQLTAIDRITGNVLWQVALPASPMASPVLVDTQLLVPTAQSIEVRSVLDGKLLHTLEHGIQTTSLAIDRDRIIATTSQGELLVGTTGSRSPMRRWPGVSLRSVPLVGVQAVVYATDAQGLMRLALDEVHPPQPWFVPEANRRIHHNPVLCDERVYVPVEGVGLVCLRARSRP